MPAGATDVQQQPQQSQESSQSQQRPSPFLRPADKLLLGGLAFAVLTAVTTRRSLAQRHASVVPAFYTSASHHTPRVNGASEALEALKLATVGVASTSMISVGLALHVFDIESMDDLRRKVRGGIGADGSGRSEQEVEEEWEEWIASTLSRKKQKDEKREGEKVKVLDEIPKRFNDRGKER